MRKVLVTGASGFVGANLARRLLADGDEVHLLLRPASNLWRLTDILQDVQVHAADLRDESAVAAALTAIRPERVFHLAVFGAYPQQTDIRTMVQANLVGAINLVEASLASGCDVIVNTGSSSEYGFKDHAPSEAEPVEPNSAYAVSKVAATDYCRYIARSRSIRIPTLRLYSVYGPFEEPSRLMPTLILRGLQNAWPPLAQPDIARDYVYVDDVVNAYLAVAEAGGSDPAPIYNVGTGRQTTLGQVAEVSQGVLGMTQQPAWGAYTPRAWDTTVWVSNNRKLVTELGWRPGFSFEEGFERTVAWFRLRTDLWPHYQSVIEGPALR